MKIQNINNTQNYLVNFGKKSSGRMTFPKRVKSILTRDGNFLLQRYYNEIKDIKPLSRKEEKLISQQIMAGGEDAQKAKQRLIESVLPTVVYLSAPFTKSGMNLEDIIQEGNLAVMKLINEVPYDGR
ncbi:hypothetical protein IJS77_00605, partial [bacterium]|nr:hypothetical protein [bacterium]